MLTYSDHGHKRGFGSSSPHQPEYSDVNDKIEGDLHEFTLMVDGILKMKGTL